MATVYSPEDQAIASQIFPEIVWRDGQPYTRRSTPDLPSDTDDPYQFGGETEHLVPADLSEGGVPPWMWGLLVGAGFVGPAVGALGGGAGAGAAGSTAASTAVPAGVGALPVAAVPTTSILGPVGAGGLTAAGAGITPGVIAPAAATTAGGAAAAGGAGAAGTGAATTGGAGAGTTAAGTGGAMSAIDRYAKWARGISGALGGAADAKAQAAAEASRLAAIQYQTAQGAQMDLGRLDLDRHAEDRTTSEGARKAALRAEIFGNRTPTRIEIPGLDRGTMNANLGPSDAARRLSQEIGARELERYRTPNTYKGGEILPQPTINTEGSSGLNKTALVTSLVNSWLSGGR